MPFTEEYWVSQELENMTSYFDEHDCEPLGAGQGPDHFMHFARLLIDSGAWNQTEFAAMFQDRIPPPTSKRFIEDLKDHLVRVEGNLHHYFNLHIYLSLKVACTWFLSHFSVSSVCCNC